MGRVRLGRRVGKAVAVRVVAVGVLVGAGLLLFRLNDVATRVWAAENAPTRASLTIDYPLNGSVFPPEITAPTFLWHDRAERAKRWVVEIRFEKSAPGMRIECAGDLLKLGEIDSKAGPGAELTAEQASMRTWRPDAATWDKIKLQSTQEPAGITIEGIDDAGAVVSSGHLAISTSSDPVGASVFYRDVPLMLPSSNQKGPHHSPAAGGAAADQVADPEHR